MSVSLLFLFCLGLVSNTYSQFLGNSIGYNNGYGHNGYGQGCGCGCQGVPAGYSDVAVFGELPVGGNTAINGQVPVIGYVNFEGYLPAGGLVSVAPNNCGCY